MTMPAETAALVRLRKLHAMADPARNPNESERRVAAARLAEAKRRLSAVDRATQALRIADWRLAAARTAHMKLENRYSFADRFERAAMRAEYEAAKATLKAARAERTAASRALTAAKRSIRDTRAVGLDWLADPEAVAKAMAGRDRDGAERLLEALAKALGREFVGGATLRLEQAR